MSNWSTPPIFRFLLQAERMALALKKAAIERQISSLAQLVDAYELESRAKKPPA